MIESTDGLQLLFFSNRKGISHLLFLADNGCQIQMLNDLVRALFHIFFVHKGQHIHQRIVAFALTVLRTGAVSTVFGIPVAMSFDDSPG